MSFIELARRRRSTRKLSPYKLTSEDKKAISLLFPLLNSLKERRRSTGRLLKTPEWLQRIFMFP